MSTKQAIAPSIPTIPGHTVVNDPLVVEASVAHSCAAIPPGVNSFQVAYSVGLPAGFIGDVLLHTGVSAVNLGGDSYPVTNISGIPDPGKTKMVSVLATIWLPTGLVWPPEILITITLDYSDVYPEDPPRG